MNRQLNTAKTLSLVSLSIGMSGMSGWLFDLEILASFNPSFIPMAPSTGFIFTALAVAIWTISSRATRSAITVGYGVSMAVVIYTGLVLVGILTGNDWNVDRVFVPRAEDFGGVTKARMSPITAVNFMLDGAALFLLTARRGGRHVPRLAGSLALTALAVTFTVLLGYVFGSPLLYGGTTIPMALTTALAFLCLDCAMIFAAGPTEFPLRHLTGKSTSARLLRWFLPLVVFGSIGNPLITARMDTVNDINLAFVAALSVLTFTLLLIGMVMFASRRLGQVIDTAEDERDLVRGRLLHQAKMAALGEMAGTIAHELNNPLTIVDGRTRQMLTKLRRGEVDEATMKTYCETMAETTERSIKIINALTAIARKTDRDPPVKTPVRKIIEETLTLCASRSKYAGVSIIVDCFDELDVDCRPGEIAQVLLNLLNNAFDALDSDGEKWIKVTCSAADGWVDMTVMDSGRGVPKDLQDKIMQPFFTTKAYSKGTGLGLSISKGIIEGHGGRLMFDEASTHTCFTVRLPQTFANAVGAGRQS